MLSIVFVWTILLGAAYSTRLIAGFGKPVSSAVVTCFYLILVAAALSWFGVNGTGLLAAFGMLLPYAVSIILVMILLKSS